MNTRTIISFIGSDVELQRFKTLVMNDLAVAGRIVDDATAIVYEVNSIETLYKIPKRFSKPTYFYITTQNKDVLMRVKEYSINGIFFPPLKKDDIISKIKHLEDHFSAGLQTYSREEYENIRVKILAKAENIPPLPDVARRLIEATRSASATVAEVTAKIKSDQGLASKVLKLINSPFYGVRGEIASIDRATVLLGFNSVRNIAMALSIDQFFQKPFHMYKTTGKALWTHSYKTACVSQAIAKELSIDPDALYMAGLMHDIGKIVMVDFLVKEVSSLEDENLQLGLNHAEIGSVILKKWSVSQMVCSAVRDHHNFSSASAFGKVIFYANRMDVDKENAASIIDEMGLILSISNTQRLKDKIIPFLLEDNGEL